MAERTASPESKRRVPELSSQPTGATHPSIPVFPPFQYVFVPNRYTVVAGLLIPQLSMLRMAPGVNGVEAERTERGDTRYRVARARTRLEQSGQMAIPYDWAPDGVSYIQSVDTRPSNDSTIRETWISVFESVAIGATEATPDEEAYAEWVSGLVKSGRLPACPPDVARKLLEIYSERHQRQLSTASKTGGAGLAAIRADQIGAVVATLREIVEGHADAKKAQKAATKRRAPDVGDAA